MRTGLTVVLAVAVFAATGGCSRRHCVPDAVARSNTLIDLDSEGDHAPVDAGITRDVEAEYRKHVAASHPAGARPYNFLALSGGGMYGSFGVGILHGWTESGGRPTFDVVTGISTGGLIATYAFLGPAYDDKLKENLLGVTRGDILRSRSILRIPFANSVYTSQPMARRIRQEVTPAVMAEVAAAHAAGRRLYIGTTNLDTRRLVIWDMGAIASRGTAEAVDLFQKIILATSSIPGVFPPVRIEVEINGCRYDELHVDGGASDEVIFRAFMVADLNRAAGMPGAYAPAGSRLYVISNGKLYADPKCVRPHLTNTVSAAARSIIYGKTRDEMYRIYWNCLESGMEFRLTAVPQDFRLQRSGGLTVTPEDQHRLFDEGRRIGVRTTMAGDGWRDLPPGTDPSEQSLPRSGTRFVTP
jgi:hypothetical protein